MLILATLTIFGTEEKPLRQALKGVHFQSRSQKRRRESAVHDKQEELPSSDDKEDDDDNDDDEPEGAFVRYRVPEFPYSSATFNIIVGFHIQAFSQSSYKDHWVTVHVLHSVADHIQCQPIGTSQA